MRGGGRHRHGDEVATGTGLTGGPVTTSGTISIASGGVGTAQIAGGAVGTSQLAANAVTQAKLSPATGAAAGKVLGTDGTNLVWQTDANSGGTVTSVGTGSGLSGGPITGSGTINLAGTQLLPTVACGSGQVPNWSGSAWACANPGSFAGNIVLPESTSISMGNIMKGGTPLSFLHNYGTNNTFIGEGAGNFTMTGNNNTALGGIALQSNGSGVDNTAVGYNALSSNTTGIYNSASGMNALHSNISGSRNTASGVNGLASNSYGQSNTASGYNALSNNDIGVFNTAVGDSALLSNTTGANNTAIGRERWSPTRRARATRLSAGRRLAAAPLPTTPRSARVRFKPTPPASTTPLLAGTRSGITR